MDKVMKKPQWAKCRRYKIVTVWNYSPIDLNNRNKDKGDAGTTLQYIPRTIVVSPNGVNKSSSITCGRGIHAYKDRINNTLSAGEKYITVWAAKWYSNPARDKYRAYRVWVGEAWYGQNNKTSSQAG